MLNEEPRTPLALRSTSLLELMPEVIATLRAEGMSVNLVNKLELAMAEPAMAGQANPVGFAHSNGKVDWFDPIPEEGAHIYAAPATVEHEPVVMGLGKVAVGPCKRFDGVPGIIYLDLPEVREHGADTTDIYPVGEPAPPQKILACVYFQTAETLQQSIDVLLEVQKEHYPTPPAGEGQEPVAWLRNERGTATGVATLDPLVLLGNGEPNGYRATYSPVYLHPAPQAVQPAANSHPIPRELRDVFSRIEDEAPASSGMQVFTQMRTAAQSYFHSLNIAQDASKPAQDEREAVEIVGYRVSLPSEPELGHWFDEEAVAELWTQKHEPLMTVAQHERIVAALSTPPMEDGAQPDMFWDGENPETDLWSESEAGAISTMVSNAWPIEIGAEFVLLRAKKHPSIKVRITALPDEDGNGLDYEIIDAAIAAMGKEKSDDSALRSAALAREADYQ